MSESTPHMFPRLPFGGPIFADTTYAPYAMPRPGDHRLRVHRTNCEQGKPRSLRRRTRAARSAGRSFPRGPLAFPPRMPVPCPTHPRSGDVLQDPDVGVLQGAVCCGARHVSAHRASRRPDFRPRSDRHPQNGVPGASSSNFLLLPPPHQRPLQSPHGSVIQNFI